MYSYTYDPKTGGLLLNSTPTEFSKEPRPVYASELDLLGFDKYWKYDGQTEAPYMWAEANSYWYRGKLVAKLKGGNLYTAPEIIISKEEDGRLVLPEADGGPLRKVNLPAMIEANREMLEIIEHSTVKKILAVYMKYKDKLDCFHVAFSGGKDSCVLLDLVKKALPKGSFVVVFGDTGMEFPDTYDVIERTHLQCIDEGIPFYIAKSHLEPEQSWQLFGPPSRTLRWCCFVHKSAPQTLKLREITGKSDFSGLAYVGVRSHESAARAEYNYENYGIKQKGQYSHNSILEWTSAEIWLYIFSNKILINEAYKKGNARAGCLFCPMSVNKADYIKQKIYPTEIKKYIDLITNTNDRRYDVKSYVSEGGWVSRRSGRSIIGNFMKYHDALKDGLLTITINSPKSNWQEWIKTTGGFGAIPYKISEITNGFVVSIEEKYIKLNPSFGKIFKQVFRKAAYCVGCGVCEANCSSGKLRFEDGVKISDCNHCLKCHDVDDGCLTYNSLRIPMEEKSMSINCFDSVLPKTEWFSRFFSERNEYWGNHGLGPNQFRSFRRFLRDGGLLEKDQATELLDILVGIGENSVVSWGIILINLVANNPQIRWYVSNLEIGRSYSRDLVLEMLGKVSDSKHVVRFVYNAFGKLMQLPMGLNLRFGHVTDEGDLVRTKCTVSDSRVILYGLYKFAEKCNDYKDFTLATLLSDSIERDGISPTLIFGLGRDEITPMLLGLSAKYPEFITASFTHDLERITLKDDKTSAQVLDLFRGGMMYE